MLITLQVTNIVPQFKTGKKVFIHAFNYPSRKPSYHQKTTECKKYRDKGFLSCVFKSRTLFKTVNKVFIHAFHYPNRKPKPNYHQTA